MSQFTETVPEVSTEPEARAEPKPDLDRMIFAAFDNVVGKVDDFVTMSGCWRKALTTIEKQLNELAYLVWEHPNTEESVCQIAAIIAYDEIRA
jgi:hypothetical protein